MLLGFKKRFIEPIHIGTKVFTMRSIDRKVKPKIGETLHMYSGLRTKDCVKISDKEKLHSIQTVWLNIYKKGDSVLYIQVDGRTLDEAEINQFVKFDGFKDENDFAEYWIQSSTGKKIKPKHTYEVKGFLHLYHWTDLKF